MLLLLFLLLYLFMYTIQIFFWFIVKILAVLIILHADESFVILEKIERKKKIKKKKRKKKTKSEILDYIRLELLS